MAPPKTDTESEKEAQQLKKLIEEVDQFGAQRADQLRHLARQKET